MSTARALALGAISGVRSASGPAFISRAAARGDMDLSGTPLAFLGSPLLARALTAAQVGEIVADKLPFVPGRTKPMPLLGRAFSGGLAGAATSFSENRGAAMGVMLGSTVAVAAAFAGEGLRVLAGKATGLPDPAVAVGEDAVVLLVGYRASRNTR